RVSLELGRVEVVRKPLELAQARLANGEEPRQRTLRQPGEPGVSLEHLIDRRTVAAESHELDPLPPGREHADGDFGGFPDQGASLFLPPAAEAARRRAALLVASLDEAGADLRGDQSLAVEDADRVAAEPHQQSRDDVVD